MNKSLFAEDTIQLLPEMELGKYKGKVELRFDQLKEQNTVLRLWNKDPLLWNMPKGSKEISSSMGWLTVVEKMIAALPMLWKFETEVHDAGFRNVVVLGMGGSSLSSFVFKNLVEENAKELPVTVIDTTDPKTIASIEKKLSLSDTLFIVASKSGSTIEPLCLFEYFYSKVKEIKGDNAGENFVAITDPGSSLVQLASKLKFRHSFLNYADIGGRYSALTYFGLVPAILMGVNVGGLLESALKMVHNCSAGVPLKDNPGIVLGAALSELARAGRDKLTYFLPVNLMPFGLWIEQLIAESTGKKGIGILPLEGNIADDVSVYGDDRVFLFVNFKESKDYLQFKIDSLVEKGHPVISIYLDSPLCVGQEFFRWEIATAIIGAIMGVNPFDQPNVQESKEITNDLISKISDKKKDKLIKADFEENDLSFYGINGGGSSAGIFEKIFTSLNEKDYVALLAYLPEHTEADNELHKLKSFLEHEYNTAVSVGYGPRYLHSTGQYFKGGPSTGLFIVFTTDNDSDLEIPGRNYTFGILQNAQAMGDIEALKNHNKMVVRIHLGKNTVKSLKLIRKILKEMQEQEV
jgi:transaldolase / glucose-6-phosphate isomerase